MSSRRVLLKNVGFLYLLQLATYAVPLLTTPYLARVLGVAAFGELGLAAAVVNYLMIIADWGIGFTGVAQVARNVNDPVALRRIFWDVTLARTGLVVASLMLLAVVTATVPDLRAIWPTMAATGLLLVQSVTNCGWFLQGLEKLGVVATGAILGRLLTFPLFILFVKSPADVWIAAAIYTGTLFVSSIVSIAKVVRVLPIFPISFDPAGMWSQLRSGWHLLLSNISSTLYVSTNMIAVGMIAGPTQAGLLNGGERIMKVVSNASSPISTAAYPRINSMMINAPGSVVRAMKKSFYAQVGLGLCLSVAMFVTAPWVTTTFLGPEFIPAIPIVQLLSIGPVCNAITAALGANAMVPLGMKRAYSIIILAAGLINVAIVFPLAHYLGALGAALSYVLIQLVLVTGMSGWLYVRRAAIIGRLEAESGRLSEARADAVPT